MRAERKELEPTPLAAALLATLDAARRAEVEYIAERLAVDAGASKIRLADVRAAMMCAGRDFLPGEES